MNKGLLTVIGIAGLIAWLCRDKKTTQMSGIRKRRARRLFFMYDGKAIPREQVEEAKRLAKSGYGTLHALWAYSADEARGMIRQGKAESLSGQRNAWRGQGGNETDFDKLITNIMNLDSKRLKTLYSFMNNQGIELELPDRQILGSQIARAMRDENIANEIRNIIRENNSKGQMTLFGGSGYMPAGYTTTPSFVLRGY